MCRTTATVRLSVCVNNYYEMVRHLVTSAWGHLRTIERTSVLLPQLDTRRSAFSTAHVTNGASTSSQFPWTSYDTSSSSVTSSFLFILVPVLCQGSMFDDIRAHVARSYTSSPAVHSRDISPLTLSNHLLLGLPLIRITCTSISITLLPRQWSSLLIMRAPVP